MDAGAANDGSERDRLLSQLSGPRIETSLKSASAGQGWSPTSRCHWPGRRRLVRCTTSFFALTAHLGILHSALSSPSAPSRSDTDNEPETKPMKNKLHSTSSHQPWAFALLTTL